MKPFTLVAQDCDNLTVHALHVRAMNPVQAALQGPLHCVTLAVFDGWHDDLLKNPNPYPDPLSALADAVNR